MGRLDEDGFLYIVERKKDLIIRGGFNIYPRDVEEAVYGFPKAASRRDWRAGRAHGEEVVAFVVLSLARPRRRRRSSRSAGPGSRSTNARRRSASWRPAEEPVGKILRKELRSQIGTQP